MTVSVCLLKLKRPQIPPSYAVILRHFLVDETVLPRHTPHGHTGMLGKTCVFVACLCASVSAFRTLPSRPAVTFGPSHRSNVATAPQRATDHATPAARTAPLHMQQFNLPRGGGFEPSSLIAPAIFAGLFFSGALGWIFNFVIGFQAPSTSAPLPLCTSVHLRLCDSALLRICTTSARHAYLHPAHAAPPVPPVPPALRCAAAPFPRARGRRAALPVVHQEQPTRGHLPYMLAGEPCCHVPATCLRHACKGL